MRALAGLLAAAFAVGASAFYLPGVAPRDFEYEERVPLMVNKLTSVKTQLPFRYYELPVCRPEVVKRESENLGEILSGDRIETSNYELYMRFNDYCKILCRKVYTQKESKKFVQFIDDENVVHLILDNLPAAVRLIDENNPEEIHYERGYPLGFTAESGGKKAHFLFNHLHFVVKYHSEAGPDSARVVGFEVEPYSVQHEYDGEWRDGVQLKTCNPNKHVSRDMLPARVDEPGEMVFTYDVVWEESEIQWSERWNLYLEGAGDDEIHWFSIVNSLMIVLFLTGMIAMILTRALYRDIAKYNEETTAEEAEEETGWKLVHGDVFRPPAGFFGPMFLSVFVGSGVQILAMAVSVMIFAVLGFLSPANRGALLTALILLFVFMGCFAGYVSARVYKMFHGKAWKRNTTLTAFSFPGVVYTIAFTVNLFIWGTGSTSAVPFGTMVALFILWFGVSTPLVFLGSYFGFKKEEVSFPCRVNQIPRQIPEQPWYLHPIPSVLVGGILPFGAVFIELFFIMSSVWLQQVYYVFGFLFLVIAILILTCAEISMVMTYFQLCSMDYNWWWRAFLTPGASAVYLFLYSVLYFSTKLDISTPIATFQYFGYMAGASWAFFLCTGAVGFVSTLWFNRTIYGALKID